MNNFFCCALLCLVCTWINTAVKTILIPRATSQDIVQIRSLFTNLDENIFFIQGNYQQSWHSEKLANYLFNGCSRAITGSQIVNRSNNALIADNFGLSTSFDGSFSVSPIIRNMTIQAGLRYYFDQYPNLFALVALPLTITSWNLRLRTKSGGTTTKFPQAYMSATPGGDVPVMSIEQAFSGCAKFGDMQSPWRASKISCGAQQRVGIPAITIALGYQAHPCCCTIAVGPILRIATGTSVNANLLFSPLVGNGKRTEIGAFWAYNSLKECSAFFNIFGTLLYTTSNKQQRTFDLCQSGDFSRYLLAKKVVIDDTGLWHYDNQLLPVLNWSTRSVTVKSPITLDVAAEVGKRYAFWNAAIGYNFYYRTAEKLCLNQRSSCNIALKGCTGTHYRTFTVNNENDLVTPATETALIPLNTSAQATITQCGRLDHPMAVPGNASTLVLNTTWDSNSNNTTIFGNTVLQDKLQATYIQPFTSTPPHVLSDKDLNLDSARQCHGYSQRIYGVFEYNLANQQLLTLLANIEFSSSHRSGLVNTWMFLLQWSKRY